MNKSIQKKAAELIAKNNLIDILQKYGTPSIVGSYRMQAMAWNDLDFYIDLADFSSDKYYDLTTELITQLKPIRFDGIHNVDQNSFFLGFELIFAGERWNIDIWWKTKTEIADSTSYADKLLSQMEQCPYLKEAILEIKHELINRKLYGLDKGKKHYHSNEIYDAVFNKGVLSTDEFISQNE